MRPLIHTLILVAGFTAARAAQADSMRCGKWVVNESSRLDELRRKCGEPQQKEQASAEVYAKNQYGVQVKVGTQVTERWTYKPGTGALPMVVTIVDGRIRSIVRAE